MIKFYDDIIQGTPEWRELRSKFISGTDAYSLLRGKPIDEILKQKNSSNWSGNYWTNRGHLLEPKAKEVYSEVFEVEVKDTGFITNSKYPKGGVSPDGVIGLNGLVEVKCFNEKRHLKVYEELDPHIITQIQFGLFISEREWCDLVLYNPEIADISKTFLTRRLYPDKSIHDKFRALLS